jgi:membrane associated rhomboid family serine protease
MFLLLPLQHEGLTVRRFPLVTLSIFLACGAIWAWTLKVESRVDLERRAIAREAAEILAVQPDLNPSESLILALSSDGAARWTLQKSTIPNLRPSEEATLRLERLEEQLQVVNRTDVRARLSYGAPTRSQPLRALTSIFTHGSWAHLLFNLWFLWVSGIALEDRLGRVVFSFLYLSAGLFAAWMHSVMSPVPSIGASGAIAGCMGLFAVLLPLERIRMGFGGLLPFPIELFGSRGLGVTIWRLPPIALGFITFFAPAIVLSGLWIVGELIEEFFGSGSSGVARWAHIGGYVYGAFAGLVLRLSGLNERLQGRVQKLSYHARDLAELRGECQQLGPGQEPLAMKLLSALRELRARKDSDFIGIEELMSALCTHLPTKESIVVLSQLLRERLSQRMEAFSVYERARGLNLHTKLPAGLRLRLAQSLDESQGPHVLAILQELTSALPSSAMSIQAWLAQAEVLLRPEFGPDGVGARACLERAEKELAWAPELEPTWTELMLRIQELHLGTPTADFDLIPTSGKRPTDTCGK